ncbi:MAG: ribosome silencing factor [Candidatus Cloacimonetes bacterium]|nr:ribosome silencing factor [Candidatus Cloacimonadota bacterium]
MQLTREELNARLVQWIMDKKAEDIEQIDVSGKTSYVDELIICTGGSDMHVRAIAEHVLAMAKEQRIHLLGKEGLEGANWVLIDFGDTILHIFREETRLHYSLDELWEKLANRINRIETDYD